MKNVIFTAILSFGLLLMNIVSLRQTNAIIKTEIITEKFDIKIKNDTDEDVKVINAGSGKHTKKYRLRIYWIYRLC